jgi:predicted transcriptional regulator
MQQASEFDALFRTVAKNQRLLSAVRSGPRRRADLADAMGVSEKTVYRHARELQAEGLLDRGTDGYRLTNLGRLYVGVRNDCEAIFRRQDAIDDVLSDVPEERVPPKRVFSDAVVTRAPPHAPGEPARRAASLVQQSHRLGALIAAVPPPLVRTVADRIAAGELRADLVFSNATVAHVEAEYPDEFERLRDGDATLHISTADVPFCLVVRERPSPTVVVLPLGSRGFTGTIRSDAEPAVEWATARCREHRRRADPLDSE